MSPTIDQLKVTLSSLSSPERAELAHFLLASLEPIEEGVADAWRAELKNRMKEIRSGKEVGKPVEEVLTWLWEQYP